MKKSTLGWVAGAVIVALGAGYVLTREPAARGGAAPAANAAAAKAGASGSGGAPVSVSTVPARQRDVDVMLEATGTVTALNSVDIRPQISSVITQVHIREGQFVKAGQLLVTLDARNDEVNVAKARAQLAKDMASLADAQRQLARSRELLAQNFISQGAVDTNQTLVTTQQAIVDADRAAISAALVGLSYTRIVAPASGRAGAINVFPGSTVQPGTAALVTITQLDPIAVSFNVPQRNLNDALRTLGAGGGKVVAVLPDARGTTTGRLEFVDNAVDAGSGTVRVKAQFDNPNQMLWPGAFVKVRMAVQTLKNAIVVPQAAIIQGPSRNVLYSVDAAGKAVLNPVEMVYADGPDAVVTGVAAGARVVVDGRQNLRPGVAVIERAATERGAKGASAGPAPAAPAAAAVLR